MARRCWTITSSLHLSVAGGLFPSRRTGARTSTSRPSSRTSRRRPMSRRRLCSISWLPASRRSTPGSARWSPGSRRPHPDHLHRPERAGARGTWPKVGPLGGSALPPNVYLIGDCPTTGCFPALPGCLPSWRGRTTSAGLRARSSDHRGALLRRSVLGAHRREGGGGARADSHPSPRHRSLTALRRLPAPTDPRAASELGACLRATDGASSPCNRSSATSRRPSCSARTTRITAVL